MQQEFTNRTDRSPKSTSTPPTTITCEIAATQPKEFLRYALSPVNEDLRRLEASITSYLPAQTVTAREIVAHVFASEGKKIRPALYFLFAKLFGYSREHLFPMAAVCEYVHTASLLHDDVVDDSTLRRNKPTANSLWGDEASVLVGDLVYARASELMAATGNLEIVAMFARVIRNMSEGELLQLEQVFNFSMLESTYLQILEHKTAALVAAACKTAALLVEASAADCLAAETFGYSVGMAFQLTDDALDYRGQEGVLGKKPLTDLCQGKLTMPALLVRKHLNAEEDRQVAQLFAEPVAARQTRDAFSFELVAKLVSKYDTVHETLMKANDYTQAAMAAISHFSPSPTKTHLLSLAAALSLRTF